MSAFYNVDQPPFNMGSTARAIAAANNGLLFDPSDMTTLYQDAAGTTPVTAVEQPVGKIIDKSGNGYHATQSVTASRPVLSARKNILLATESLATQSVTTLAAQYTLSFTGTGSVTLSGAATGTLTGTGTDRRSLTFTPTAGTLTLTVSGSVTKAQVELGAIAGPYQRVNTSSDYDTDERYFKKYLRFDGIDDYLNLPYMGLYANGSVSVVMAGRASAQWGVVISEGSTTSGSPQFAPLLTTTETGDTLVVIRDDNNGNVLLHYTPSMFDKVSVVSSIISASDSKAYRDSVFKTALSYTRSTPVTMNTTAIGARVSTSVVEFFGGNIYGLIITKSALTDAQRIKCERHVARKSGVIL